MVAMIAKPRPSPQNAITRPAGQSCPDRRTRRTPVR